MIKTLLGYPQKDSILKTLSHKKRLLRVFSIIATSGSLPALKLPVKSQYKFLALLLSLVTNQPIIFLNHIQFQMLYQTLL
jgi:hypothetical protein